MRSKHPPLLREFGNHVRELRENKSISQEELGRLARLHRTYIGMIERGEKNITLLNMKKLAEALGTSIQRLIP